MRRGWVGLRGQTDAGWALRRLHLHRVEDINRLIFAEVAIFVPQVWRFPHRSQRKDVVDYRVDVRGLGDFLRRVAGPPTAARRFASPSEAPRHLSRMEDCMDPA